MTSAEDILGPGGPVARALGASFEPRPEQAAMARGVLEAMRSRSHLLVEAGTGVGKSFAYLVPAMLRAMVDGERTVIATNTIALQEQLMGKDVPLLRRVMGEALGGEVPRAVLVKGRGNYVSLRRLTLASSRQERLLADPAARRSLHAIEDWALTTDDGTLSSLPVLERPGVWDKVQSDSSNCMGRKCPTFEKCFYQTARGEMDGSPLLITNHALFFSDLALRSQEVSILPRYDHVVLDEAHNVEDVASDHFGVQLSEGRVAHLLTTLSQPRAGKGYLPQLALLGGAGEGLPRAIALVEQAQAAARGFFDACLALLAGEGRPFGVARERGTRRLREPGLIPNVLSPVMRELSLRLKGLREQVKNDADRFELNAYAVRAELIAQDAEALVSQRVPDGVYWLEGGGVEGPGRGTPRVTLACSPIEVAGILRERLFSGGHSVVLTSATLSTRWTSPREPAESREAAFAHTLSRLGAEGAATLQLGSPFDYASQVRLIIDKRAGNPSHGNTTPRLARVLLEHIRETDGGAFVLFTSLASLAAVARELTGPLAEMGMPLLAQGRDGPRSLLLQLFREDRRSVLLGAASFWQGIDVRGDALRNVIIVKLPFDPPDRPLTEARGELIRSRGGDPFREDALPRAVIRFKQGFGRLVRSRSDRGRVVVLDPRLVDAEYGKRFLAALPAGARPEVVEPEIAPSDPDAWF